MLINNNYDFENIIIPFVDTNCYILSKDGKSILIDAAGDGDLLVEYFENHNLHLEAVLLTHGHYDHIEALDCLRDKFPDLRIYANANEKIVIENRENNLARFDLSRDTLNVITYIGDKNFSDKFYDINELGLNIKMLQTPGHTCGCCCYYIKELKILFAGDTLFKDTYGRTDLPTSDMKQLVISVAKNIMQLPDDTIVYPGHSEPTTIGHERVHSELMRAYIIDWAESN